MPALRRHLVPEVGLTHPLGSIQAFPRRRGPRTLADVWRLAGLPGASSPRLRPARLEDYAALRALQRQALPCVPPLGLRQLESRRQVFPEGQLVAESDAQAVGAGCALVVPWDAIAQPTWSAVTGDGYFTTHDLRGDTLFACDFAADVSRRGFAVGRTLNLARRRLCRRLNLRRVAAAVPLCAPAAGGDAAGAEDYAKRVVWGEADDAMLRFHLSQGFQYCGPAPGFFPEGAGRHAALLVWVNPHYAPPGPGADAHAQQRQRRCA